MPRPTSVAIIGGGLAGLTAGTLLARSGVQVTVLERNVRPGGLVQTFRRDAARFDTGFHFLTDGGPDGALRRILDYLGIRESMDFRAPDPDAQFVLHATDGESVPLPVGLEPVRTVLIDRFPEQGRQLDIFWALLRGELAAKPWLAHLATATATRLAPANLSLGEALDRAGLSGEARHLLLRLAGLVGQRSSGLSFGIYAAIMGSAPAGSWRLAGGGDGLIAPLTGALRAAGGDLCCRREVSRIIWSGREVDALVCTGGEEVRADLYLATCHPAETLRLAGANAFRPGFRTALAERGDSAGTFILHATLATPTMELGRRHHLLTCPVDSPIDDLYAVTPAAFAPEDPPTLEILGWLDCRRCAPWADKRGSRRPPAYTAWKEHLATAVEAIVARRWPDLPGHITGRWTCSPVTFRDYTRTRAGSALGLAQNRDALSAHHLGPRNRLRNLYFAGQNFTVPGILGTMGSALEISGRIAGVEVAPSGPA